jgi:predicted secreted protein
MAVNNASTISLFLGGSRVAVATSHTLSFERETIETTSKADGTTATFIPGKKSSTVSVEGYVDPAKSENFDELYDLYDNDSTFTFTYTDNVVGNNRYEGTCFFTSLERSGGQNEAETFSGELQITGSVSKVAITSSNQKTI